MTAGFLLLEDGRRFEGVLRGAPPAPLSGTPGPGQGEVVFQTGMTGYQEVITDPSYRGQIVTFTAPHIGNTGVNPADAEAERPVLSGIVVRELAETPSSWRARGALEAYLAAHGVPCLSEVDTRALTRHIRSAGALRGALVPAATDPAAALAGIRALPGLTGRDLVGEVAPRAVTDDAADPRDAAHAAWFPPGEFPVPAPGNAAPRIVVVHCGMKEGIAASLRARGARVRLVPPTTGPEDILAARPHGLLLSNGPGDPEDVATLIATVKRLVGRVPMLGICLGHQVLGLALGGRTYKMPFGHHGQNHPVRDLMRDAVLVTSQNHGFAVDPESLRPAAGGDTRARVAVTHVSLNDGVLEGFAVPELDVAAVQFHPEACGGPHDARFLFDGFLARAACAAQGS